MKKLIWIIVLVVLIIVIGSAFDVFEPDSHENEESLDLRFGEEVSVIGEVVCLPHKDTSGPITLECAFGLLGDDGNHYGLANLPGFPGAVDTGDRVRVTGVLEERERETKYDIVGTIDVADIASDAEATETHSFEGITFSRSSDFGLAISPDQILADSTVPPCDEHFDYCLYYLGGEYEGTNFGSAGVRILKRRDLPTLQACLGRQPDGYTGLTPEIRERETYSISEFPPLTQGAAGHTSEGTLYRLWYSEGCVEFETRIAQAQFENFEPGTVEEFTESDKSRLQTRIDEVLARVEISSGEEIEW
jgi:hypothetical protein